MIHGSNGGEPMLINEQQWLAILDANSDSAAMDWLQGSLSAIHTAADPLSTHHIVSAMARRKTGDKSLVFNTLDVTGQEITVTHWQQSDVARLLLSLMTIKVAPQTRVEVIASCYQSGDERERAALLKGLSWLDPDGEWVIEAEDCCRSNSLLLFSAIAMNNNYVATHFSARAYNQLVLKSLFLSFDIVNVCGLQRLRNAELSVMCCDYMAERVAAGREYPPSIWLAIELMKCSNDTLAQAKASLLSDDPDRRYYLLLALSQQGVPDSLREVVSSLATRETNASVSPLLAALITRYGI